MIMGKYINEQKFILFILFLGALILRLPAIGSPLAGDEAITFNHYVHLNIFEILFNYPDSNQHSLFSILSNFSLLLFGEHEIAFRLPSLVTGVLAIPLAYCTCRSLGISQSISITSSLFLALYVPHIAYSQEGRGYALTVFLALCLIYSSIHILGSQRLWIWALSLILSATGLVITLPSNVFFVVGGVAFCWILRIFENSQVPTNQKPHSCYLTPYLLSFFLIAVYLIINLEDLQLSAQANSRGNFQWVHFKGIAEFLVSPWGIWLYPIFIVGFFSNLKKDIRYAIFALILIPAALSLVTGIIGFARIYIYLAPFILMMVSIGIISLIDTIRSSNKNLGYIVSAFTFIWLIYLPISSLPLYYSQRMQYGNGYMKDAIKIREHFNNEPLNILPVITNTATGRSILIHYLGENISKRIRLISAGKKIERILFISQNDTPPNEYQLDQVFNDVGFNIPQKSIKLIKSFNSFQVFEWDVRLSRLSPGNLDLDHESQLAGLNQSIQTYSIEKPRAVGNTSLLINNPSLPSVSPTVFIGFPNTFDVDTDGKEGFILSAFIKASLHKTLFRTMMVNKDASKIPSAYLNRYLEPHDSDFEGRSKGGKWEMTFLLSSIGVGKRSLREIIETSEKKTLIDGVQTYIIQ
jgi:hypothetical protein